MSKQANKTVIGAFVVGAIILAVIGVLVFGSGKFLAELDNYVLHFEGSVKGLNIGAPVVFRGVKIGSVTDIALRYDPDELAVYIPVIIEVERGRFQPVAGKKKIKRRRIKELIDLGLRAKLELQSMVTGQLMVDLDFYPDEPAKLIEEEGIKYPEIPTIPSKLQRIAKTIEQLPLDVLFDKLMKTVEGIERVVNSPEIMDSLHSLNQALKDVQHLVKNIDRHVEPLVTSIEDTSEAARSALVQAEKTLAMEDGVPGELASGINNTLEKAGNAMEEAEKTLTEARHVVSEDSETIYELNSTLEELSGAARSIRILTDYLEQHPEALIKGKGGSIRRIK
jgi:paraquat-inducible protein B